MKKYTQTMTSTLSEALKFVNASCIYKFYQPNEKPSFFLDEDNTILNNTETFISNSSIEIKYFIECVKEVKKAKLANNSIGRINTPKITYQILKANNELAEIIHHSIINNGNYAMRVSNDYSVSLVKYPLIIGIFATQNGLASRHAFNPYLYALEIRYYKASTRKKYDEDLIIKSYLFDLLKNYQIDFLEDEFRHENNDRYSFDTDSYRKLEKLNISFQDKNKIYDNNALNLFFDSKQIKNQEIRLLYLYKIFEYFSSKHLTNKTYLELLSINKSIKPRTEKHLSLKTVKSFIDRYSKNNKDREMIKLLFIDMIDITLPNLQAPSFIKSNLTNKKRTIKDQLEIIAETLYSTRNSIVHSKNNFDNNRNTNICLQTDIESFNNFIEKCAIDLIIRFPA